VLIPKETYINAYLPLKEMEWIW